MTFEIKLVPFRSRLQNRQGKPRRVFVENSFTSVRAVELPPEVVSVHRGGQTVLVRKAVR